MLLALDTCLASCSAAVFDETTQRIIAARREFMERGHAEVIAPMVQTVLQEAGLTAHAIDRIAVTIGPGTFTGLRIGLALAQGMSLANTVPLVALDTMRATAAPLFGKGSHVTVCHKAGATGQFYVQHFADTGTPFDDIRLLKPEQIDLTANTILIGTGADAIGKTATRKPECDLPDASSFAPYASTLPASLSAKPVYIRATDAKPQVASVAIARVGPDAASILSNLHAASFSESWKPEAIAEMLTTPGTLALLLQSGASPAAMLIARVILDEAEILTFATAPQHRQRGHAKALLQSLTTYLQSLGVKTVHLEVASDNPAALKLYQGGGYSQSGLRKFYYASGANAILMCRSLS